MEHLEFAGDRATEAAGRRRIARWTGLAARYDTFRPSAPAAIPEMLTQLAGVSTPAHVVDLGAGTGLSTLIWAGRATRVTGIEPNADMRRRANTRLAASGKAEGVRFIAGTSGRTGLPDGCADIVTASQALHWMEPVSTLAEVARVLRPGGVFAAYDYDWPPTITPETERLFHIFMERVWRVAAERGVTAEAPGWPKSGHIANLRASGHFPVVKEVALQGVEDGDADRFLGLIFSNVVAVTLMGDILAARDLGVEAFERDVRRAFAEITTGAPRWYLSYHMRIGVA